jgi:hypothetical protein
MTLEPSSDFKVDRTKYGKLRDEHLQVYVDGQDLSVVHAPTGITISADSRDNVNENWEIAQQAVNSALEHQESVGPSQPERKGSL